jgi:hypothetical protein
MNFLHNVAEIARGIKLGGLLHLKSIIPPPTFRFSQGAVMVITRAMLLFLHNLCSWCKSQLYHLHLGDLDHKIDPRHVLKSCQDVYTKLTHETLSTQ